MKFFKLQIENSNFKDTWLEDHNIPFKSKTYTKYMMKTVYKGCFFYKENIDLLDNLPENLKVVSGEDNVYSHDVYMIFSDGGSFNNGKKDPNKPAFGSTATIVTKNGEEIYRFNQAKKDVTNNYCELKAGLIGLEYLDKLSDGKKTIILVSDSQYYIKSLNEWMSGYIRRGWKNNEGKPVSNKDLLQKFNGYMHNSKFDIFTCWVRGHEDDRDTIWNKFNVECDRLCNESINEILLEHGLPIRK